MSIFFAVLLIVIGIYLKQPLPRFGTKKKTTSKPKNSITKTVAVGQTREVVDLLILSITAGLTTPNAIKQSCRLSESQFAVKLNDAIKSYELGANFDYELTKVGQHDRYWKLVTNLLRQSWEQGSAISENLTELSDYLIDLERAQVLKKVRSAAVKSVLPLGVCFLPAFIAVVVVPIVAGLVSQ